MCSWRNFRAGRGFRCFHYPANNMQILGWDTDRLQRSRHFGSRPHLSVAKRARRRAYRQVRRPRRPRCRPVPYFNRRWQRAAASDDQASGSSTLTVATLDHSSPLAQRPQHRRWNRHFGLCLDPESSGTPGPFPCARLISHGRRDDRGIMSFQPRHARLLRRQSSRLTKRRHGQQHGHPH